MKRCFLALLATASFVVRAEDAATGEEVVAKNMIGIDLGTTYSCVGVWQNDRVEIVANDQGHRITPSWVAFPKNGDARLVGDAAKNQAPMNPENTIFDSKRMLGRRFDECKEDIKNWPFKVINNKGNPAIQLEIKGEKKMFAPEQISAMVLQKMKETAETFLGEPVTDAVVTVPAYFNDAQRSATKNAGVIAGINVARILNEPTAAAIAYGLDKKKESKIVVFDLGGGTFDVSCLVVDDGVFEVKAVNGDTHLGGQDFDQRMIDYIIKDIKSKTEVDVASNNKIRGKIRQECEKAKRYLSNNLQATIEIDGIKKGSEDKEYVVTLSRAKFEEINMDLFKKTIKPVELALKDAKWSIADVNDVVLVGGSTRIPKVQELLKDFFKGKELSKSINPDEAVAYGATLQAGILMKKKKTEDLLVLDATPLTLGIETVNGVFTKLIDRNTIIPAKKTQIFSTASDNQDTVDINVFEGERAMAKDNHFLGHFFLRNIPLAPRGVPQIEVTFEIDANGILTVTAVDKASGAKESINITSDKRRLTDAEIQRMVQEAEDNKVKDQELKEKIEARSALENYLYSLRSQVNDEKGLGAKLDGDDKKTVLDTIAEKIKWVEDNKEGASKEDFEEQKAAVEKIVGPIISKLYEGGAAPNAEDHEDL